MSSFQLEAGELQHAEIHRLLEQLQRRRADIAAHTDIEAGFGNHLAHQGGNGALAVRAGNGDDRSLGLANKQFDVTDDLHTTLGRRFQFGGRQRDTRARDDHVRLLDQCLVEPVNELNLRRQLILAGRVGAGIHHQWRHATAEEVIDTGESGFAQSDDDDHGLTSPSGWQDPAAPARG